MLSVADFPWSKLAASGSDGKYRGFENNMNKQPVLTTPVLDAVEMNGALPSVVAGDQMAKLPGKCVGGFPFETEQHVLSPRLIDIPQITVNPHLMPIAYYTLHRD
jgi:hypothetical protein